MTQRVVIADAGPLIALARIEALYLLRQLFGRVCITTTVRDEILPAKAAFADANLLVRMLAEGWIDVVALGQTDYRPLNPGVDAGEASSIQLAKYWREAGHAVLLVMDDRAGRLEAKHLGLALIGLNWSPNCGHHDWHEALSMVGRFGRLRRTGTGRRWETRYSPQVL